MGHFSTFFVAACFMAEQSRNRFPLGDGPRVSLCAQRDEGSSPLEAFSINKSFEQEALTGSECTKTFKKKREEQTERTVKCGGVRIVVLSVSASLLRSCSASWERWNPGKRRLVVFKGINGSTLFLRMLLFVPDE